ncbi:putative cytochrome P450 [Rosa chinensis]|uniref:Putative cytochrome P450 n=1 Tax=Rosa chinensis TaxID=74649 RepID=A0A2P6QHF0_ROSCH|nr:putative cytochrome P450 [Rosa chinensis]
MKKNSNNIRRTELNLDEAELTSTSTSDFELTSTFLYSLLTKVLADLHKKYGSVVKLWLGPTQLLVSIKDPTLIRDMLLKAANNLPKTGRAFHLASGRSSLWRISRALVQ